MGIKEPAAEQPNICSLMPSNSDSKGAEHRNLLIRNAEEYPGALHLRDSGGMF